MPGDGGGARVGEGLSCCSGEAGGGFSVTAAAEATAGSVAAIGIFFGRVGTFFFRLFGMPTPSFGPISALCTLQHFVHSELGVWCWTMHWEGLDGSGWRRVGQQQRDAARAQG